jgi:GAF domain-containing protein
MEDQLDGRAVARALRGPAEIAPAPGDLHAVLQQLVDAARTVLAADGIGLMLAGEEGQPRSLVTTDAVAELLEQVQQDFGEGPGVAAYTQGEPVAVTDLGADPRWIRLAAVVGQVSVRAVASVPVRLGGVVVGALNAYAVASRAWTPEELGGLDAFAELAAGVMAGGVRLDHRQAEVGQLRHALTSRILIEQAKGVLVAREGLDDRAAFQRLRRQARNAARPMVDVAAEVIDQARQGSGAARAQVAAAGSARRLAELEELAAGVRGRSDLHDRRPAGGGPWTACPGCPGRSRRADHPRRRGAGGGRLGRLPGPGGDPVAAHPAAGQGAVGRGGPGGYGGLAAQSG